MRDAGALAPAPLEPPAVLAALCKGPAARQGAAGDMRRVVGRGGAAGSDAESPPGALWFLLRTGGGRAAAGAAAALAVVHLVGSAGAVLLYCELWIADGTGPDALSGGTPPPRPAPRAGRCVSASSARTDPEPGGPGVLGLAGSLKAAGTLGSLAGSQAGAALAATLSAFLFLRFVVAPACCAAQALSSPRSPQRLVGRGLTFTARWARPPRPQQPSSACGRRERSHPPHAHLRKT